MEKLFFRTLVTKNLVANSKSDDDRFFEGLLTVEMKDKQGEITIVDELYKVLPIWMDRGAPITDTHSNRVVGKGINYSKTETQDVEGNVYPAIKITGKIHKDYELDDDIWSKIKSGEYKGLSFGGATKADREPVKMKDGSIAYALTDLEHYEVAVCEDPAVPLALITTTTPLGKAMIPHEDLGNGKMKIKCDNFGCYVEKDVDFSNTQGDHHTMYNQDVDEDASSGRKMSTDTSPEIADSSEGTTDAGWQGIDHPQPKKKEGEMNQRYAGVRGLGGYNTAQQGSEPIAQIAEVPNKEEETNKSKEIYINNSNSNKDNDMTNEDTKLEEEKKQVEATTKEAEDHKEEEKQKQADDKKDEEKAKAFETSVKTGLDGLSEQLKAVAESIKGIDSRVKALETPTDLPAAPAGSQGGDDVGADITVPAQPYPQGDQAGLDDDRANENAPAGDSAPSMQEKPLHKAQLSQHTFTTETPRPNAAIEKSGEGQTDFSPILKDARSEGFEGLSNVARNILKGKYYTPRPEEVAGY